MIDGQIRGSLEVCIGRSGYSAGAHRYHVTGIMHRQKWLLGCLGIVEGDAADSVRWRQAEDLRISVWYKIR